MGLNRGPHVQLQWTNLGGGDGFLELFFPQPSLVSFVGLDPKLHALVFGHFNFVEQMQVMTMVLMVLFCPIHIWLVL